jgi:hypothetical protein
MEEISDSINKMFETLFKTNNNEHPFLKDLKTVNNVGHIYRKQMADKIKKHTSHIIINEIPEGEKIEPNYETLDVKELKNLDKELNNILNFRKIHHIVSYISQFIIKSNITSENKLYKKISKNEKINIMIIGSGPVGLFLACYLHLYYNKTYMNSYPRVNIVLYDSKIDKPGFRKPYNRQRIFATASSYLNLLIPKLFCWHENNEKDYINVNIFILEYILFTIANNNKIPMIYEDYSWDTYKQIIKKGNFDVVFDCSGGRLSNDVIKNIDPSWLDNIKISSESLGKTLVIDQEKNLVLLNHDSKHIINYFYGSIILYYNDETLTFHINYDIDIMNKNDLIYLNKIKNKYYKHSEAMHLIKGIKDDNSRDYFYNCLLAENKDFLVLFDVWGIYMRHQIKISDTINIGNKKILFIGAGDTIFHSHFITGAGLNRIFDFTVKCANKLIDL